MSGSVVRPQPGFQEDVLTCPADVLICGGSAGAGKSWVLQYDAMRWIGIENYDAIIFRRTSPEIKQLGGLWDKSFTLYAPVGGKSNENELLWTFDAGSQIKFSHLQYEANLHAHQGGEYCFIGFDELTHFTRKMFLYLLSRNRSICGVDPVIRATCNPDPDSFVADMIAWWIDQDTGFPIPERSGVLRWFTVDQEQFVWGDTKEEVIAKCPHIFNDPKLIREGINPLDLVRSMTFIPGSIYQNKELLRIDKAYLGKLLSQDEDTKLRLLYGNWKIRTDGSMLFHIDNIDNMFTNIPPEDPRDKYYITCDHARHGRDLCVIITWKGWRVIRIDIIKKSDTNDIIKVIQTIRRMYRPIPASHVIIDQDGIGVKDFLKCKLFQGSGTAYEEDPSLQVAYKNKRTQMYYKLSEKVKEFFVSIDLENIWLWEHDKNELLQEPIRIKEIKINGKTYEVKFLIREDLRTVRIHNPDTENRKQITPKEEQKNALGGRSPDLGDALMMRGVYDYIRIPTGMSRR